VIDPPNDLPRWAMVDFYFAGDRATAKVVRYFGEIVHEAVKNPTRVPDHLLTIRKSRCRPVRWFDYSVRQDSVWSTSLPSAGARCHGIPVQSEPTSLLHSA